MATYGRSIPQRPLPTISRIPKGMKDKMKPTPKKQSPRQSAVERIYGMVQKVASPTGGTIGKLPKRDRREAKPLPRGRIQGVVYQGTPGPKGNYPTVTNKQAARAADRYGIKAPTVGVKANVMEARASRNEMPLVQFDKNKQPLRDANGDYVMAQPRNPAKAARQRERALIYRDKENAWAEGATTKRMEKHYGKGIRTRNPDQMAARGIQDQGPAWSGVMENNRGVRGLRRAHATPIGPGQGRLVEGKYDRAVRRAALEGQPGGNPYGPLKAKKFQGKAEHRRAAIGSTRNAIRWGYTGDANGARP